MSVLWPPPLFPSFVLISKRRLSLEEPKIVYVCFVHPLAMPIENAPRCIVIYTEMAKKVCPRLRELVPVARGGQEAVSRNLIWPSLSLNLLNFCTDLPKFTDRAVV